MLCLQLHNRQPKAPLLIGIADRIPSIRRTGQVHQAIDSMNVYILHPRLHLVHTVMYLPLLYHLHPCNIGQRLYTALDLTTTTVARLRIQHR
jgi:hypothetical protein